MGLAVATVEALIVSCELTGKNQTSQGKNDIR